MIKAPAVSLQASCDLIDLLMKLTRTFFSSSFFYSVFEILDMLHKIQIACNNETCDVGL